MFNKEENLSLIHIFEYVHIRKSNIGKDNLLLLGAAEPALSGCGRRGSHFPAEPPVKAPLWLAMADCGCHSISYSSCHCNGNRVGAGASMVGSGNLAAVVSRDSAALMFGLLQGTGCRCV